MRVPVAAALLLLLSLLAQPSRAAVEEIPIPGGAAGPLAIAFDREGQLWLTLDATWAVGRYDPGTRRLDLAPLATAKTGVGDSLWGLAFAPDGAVWTGSITHLHRIDPATLEARAYALPTPSDVTGDVHVEPDGIVWYALVSAERLVRLDPANGAITEHAPPRAPFGPLSIDAGPGGLHVTGTYGDTFARLDPVSRNLSAGSPSLLVSPVGLTHDATHLWVGEMGGSSVARVDPVTGNRVRYPTTPSPYYPVSGPTGILVARDGTVWFAEHFADRIARLDPVRGTLVEHEVPSSPGTNVQRVAEAPDGSVWFAELSANRLGWISPGREEPTFSLPERVTVAVGGRATVPLPPKALEFGTPDPEIRARREGGNLLLETGKAPPGDHLVLVSEVSGKTRVGRYLTLSIGSDAGTPAAAAAVALLAIALAAATRRRR